MAGGEPPKLQPCPIARHALGVAPPRAVRARLVMHLGALHHPEKARLVAAAVEYHTKAVIGNGLVAVIGNGLVRAQLLDERVAPGGGVGVEALEVERVGSKACADAQVGARDLVVGRAVLVGDVLDQARAPAHCFSARIGDSECFSARIGDSDFESPFNRLSRPLQA
jgi:hypothetical protein